MCSSSDIVRTREVKTKTCSRGFTCIPAPLPLLASTWWICKYPGHTRECKRRGSSITSSSRVTTFVPTSFNSSSPCCSFWFVVSVFSHLLWPCFFLFELIWLRSSPPLERLSWTWAQGGWLRKPLQRGPRAGSKSFREKKVNKGYCRYCWFLKSIEPSALISCKPGDNIARTSGQAVLLLKSDKVPKADGSQGYKAVVQRLEVIPAWKTITLENLQMKLKKNDFFIKSNLKASVSKST